MAYYTGLLGLCLVALVTVDAAPRGQLDSDCLAAGHIADTLLSVVLEPSMPPDFQLRDLFNEVLHIDYDDFSFTKLCPLDGLETVGTLVNMLDRTPDELMFGMFKGVYDYAMVAVAETRWFEYQEVANSSGLTLIRALDAAGLTQLDPDGVTWMAERRNYLGIWGDLAEPEALSTHPLDVQCRDITNSLRKSWNEMVQVGRPYGDQMGKFYREYLYNYTGIVVPQGPGAQRKMEQLSCRILESATSLRSLYDLLRDRAVVHFFVSQLYGQHMWYIKKAYLEEDGYNNSYNYGYNYGYDYVHGMVRDLVGLLNDMGLLDLLSMTDIYPYPGEPFVNPYHD